MVWFSFVVIMKHDVEAKPEGDKETGRPQQKEKERK